MQPNCPKIAAIQQGGSRRTMLCSNNVVKEAILLFIFISIIESVMVTLLLSFWMMNGCKLQLLIVRRVKIEKNKISLL